MKTSVCFASADHSKFGGTKHWSPGRGLRPPAIDEAKLLRTMFEFSATYYPKGLVPEEDFENGGNDEENKQRSDEPEHRAGVGSRGLPADADTTVESQATDATGQSAQDMAQGNLLHSDDGHQCR